jgi:uncharacterized membrane protein YfcA
MTNILGQLDVSPAAWAMAAFGSFLLGMAKGGIKGLGAIITTILALIFGSKASTGIVMPLLIVGDLFAVWYYHRHAQWIYLWKFMPWMVVGVLVGVWYGKDLPEAEFKQGMAVLILLSVLLMWYLDRKKELAFPDKTWFSAIMGGISGFATMVGNLAGPFSELYFLAQRVSKEMFIGTAAWIFLITNLFKLPFHIWSWETIHARSLAVDLVLLAPLLAGLWAGVRLVRVINQRAFRALILVLTALGALIILVRQ